VKKFILALLFAAFFCDTLFAQSQPTWTTTTRDRYNGYDYELWSEDNIGTSSMKLTGDDGSGASAVGGTFEATWSGTKNVLFRSGRKWNPSNQTHEQIGNISIDFAATWTSSDGARMLGVYGWAYYASGSEPTADEDGTSRSYSNQIEYYIIQSRGGWNPATATENGKNLCKQRGSGTIDDIAYNFYVCDRINKWALTGNGDVNFKQYFSVPQNTSSHRTSGIISVSQHFNKWEELGMKMDGPMYEVAMKVESYTGNNDGSGSAKVTRNLLTIGGEPPPVTPPLQSESCITLPAPVPTDPYTACFKHTNDKCYICKTENEGDGNTCASDWVWSGNYVDDNLDQGYWYQEITCPITPIRLLSPISTTQFSVRSLSNSSLQIESNSDVAIYLYNAKGKLAQKIDVPTGSSIVKLSVPAGIYIVKNGKTNQAQRILVK
jgi:hypothetical protein